MKTVFRNKHYKSEPIWHVQIGVLIAIILQLLIPVRYTLGLRHFGAGLEILLLIAMSFTTPKEPIFRSIGRRINVLALLILAGIANGYSLFKVSDKLLNNANVSNGRDLVLAAVNIYLTNIIIFGLFYWEMDGGGPGQRIAISKDQHDFMFPQDQNETYKHPKWQPTFIDYIYVSATNGMAFSPTDTLPLTRRAKLLMLLQATISLVTVALVAARAVNILG